MNRVGDGRHIPDAEPPIPAEGKEWCRLVAWILRRVGPKLETEIVPDESEQLDSASNDADGESDTKEGP